MATSARDQRAQIQPKKKLPDQGRPNLRTNKDFGKTPLFFIANEGQMDEKVVFYIQGKDKTLYFTSEGVTFALAASQEVGANKSLRELGSQDNKDLSRERTRPIDRMLIRDEMMERVSSARWVVKLDFVGANPKVRPAGTEKTGAVVSYFKGKPEDWHTGLATYSKVVYENLWPGIDLVYSGDMNRLKYEFIVHPGADPSRIRLAYRGVSGIGENEDGQLEVKTPSGGFHDDIPVAFQVMDAEKKSVRLAYRIEKQLSVAAMDDRISGLEQSDEASGVLDSNTFIYGFRVDEYDRSLPLVLDPAILLYCGYIGGSANDYGRGIAVDSSGNTYITGETYSTEASFPAMIGPDLIHNGSLDAFVAKVSSSGTALLYCGYIGGSANDYGRGIAVDSSGNAYVTGISSSSQASFPVSVGPDLTFNGLSDGFVAKVSSSGAALVYCGYIGGSIYDSCNAIAVDGSGNAYVTGITTSTGADFPVHVGPDLTFNGYDDAFVAKVSSSGAALVYCGYIGGSGSEDGRGIAVDGSGSAYIMGHTASTEASFPVHVGPDLNQNGSFDTFIAKISPSGTALSYCGYVGGLDHDFGSGIALDGSGNAYITGYTSSNEATFPVLNGPDLTHNGAVDAFVAKINTAGTALVYCGFIGGSGDDYGSGIAVDTSGATYVAGDTDSDQSSFPAMIGPDLVYNGNTDAFVAKVAPSGTTLVYCGYIGGSGLERGYGIALDTSGHVYITGNTESSQSSFPAMIGPDLIYNGSLDAFVAKISTYELPPLIFDGHDYDGNVTSDVSLWRPANGFWYIKDIQRTGFGTPGDIPVSGDYDNDGATDIAVFRPSTAMWAIKDQYRVYYGLPGDIPVPGDYDGNGTTDVAIFRPSTGMWAVKDQFIVYFGGQDDVPVPGDYDGDGDTDVAVFNMVTGLWQGKDQFYVYLGRLGDIPVPADYEGNGRTDLAIFRPSSGMWAIGGYVRVYFGSPGDIPVPGDYDGNGTADIAVFRPMTGLWAVKDQFRVYYGQAGDIPLVR